MNTSCTELHSNWRALTTIHYPLKRFIHSSQLGTNDVKPNEQRHEIQGVQGAEAQQFYEKTVSTATVLQLTGQIAVANIHHKTKYKTVMLPFDKQKFFRLAMSNNVAELRKFVYQRGDVNVRDNYGWTGLMMAACEGASETVEYLLQLGAEREAKDKQGNNALELARKKGHRNIVELLTKTQEQKEITNETEEINLPDKAPFYCDLCQRHFNETSLKQHRTSTVHQFNAQSSLPANKLQKFNISAKNRGLQLMLKQGWDKESGLGPLQNGRLYPVKTVIRKQRSGLGIEQPPARVTHFTAFDPRATQRNGLHQAKPKARNRRDMQREKQREWKRERRLRNELS